MQLERSYFPPASAHRNEFHILKFYSLSSTLVSAILSNTETKMFVTKNPVFCTEVEKNFLKLQHASTILHLQYSPQESSTQHSTDVHLCFLVAQALKKDTGDRIKAQKFHFAEQCYSIALATQTELKTQH